MPSADDMAICLIKIASHPFKMSFIDNSRLNELDIKRPIQFDTP